MGVLNKQVVPETMTADRRTMGERMEWEEQ